MTFLTLLRKVAKYVLLSLLFYTELETEEDDLPMCLFYLSCPDLEQSFTLPPGKYQNMLTFYSDLFVV